MAIFEFDIEINNKIIQLRVHSDIAIYLYKFYEVSNMDIDTWSKRVAGDICYRMENILKQRDIFAYCGCYRFLFCEKDFKNNYSNLIECAACNIILHRMRDLMSKKYHVFPELIEYQNLQIPGTEENSRTIYGDIKKFFLNTISTTFR